MLINITAVRLEGQTKIDLCSKDCCIRDPAQFKGYSLANGESEGSTGIHEGLFVVQPLVVR